MMLVFLEALAEAAENGAELLLIRMLMYLPITLFLDQVHMVAQGMKKDSKAHKEILVVQLVLEETDIKALVGAVVIMAAAEAALVEMVDKRIQLQVQQVMRMEKVALEKITVLFLDQL